MFVLLLGLFSSGQVSEVVLSATFLVCVNSREDNSDKSRGNKNKVKRKDE